MHQILPYLDPALKVVSNVAHKVPYGYGDKAVDFAKKYIDQHQKDSLAKEALTAQTLLLNQQAVARGEQLSVYPDWCDHGSRLFARVCEEYLDSPIWCTVFILDAIALWLIFCILRRQRQQTQEDTQARLGPARSVRMKRLWGKLRHAVRLTGFNATLSAAGEGDLGARWKKAFEEVAKARDHRKKYLWKKDYDLMGVMGRGMGPVVMCFTSSLILYEAHAWFTLVLPSFGLPPRVYLLVAIVTAVAPFRIFLDYARTSFTDPGSPQSFSASGTGQGQCDGDVELELGGRSEVKKCHRCDGPKPSRCHHCKVCRRCVLKMDHHCPFVNNCVGLRNHRFFIMFLLELVLACTIIVAAMLPQLLSALRHHPGDTLAHRIHIITSFAVALIADSMLAPFFYFHMQLVIVNETTLENMKTRSQRMDAKMKHKQHEFKLKKAEKAGEVDKMEEIKMQMTADAAKEEERRSRSLEESARHSQGSFIDNFTEVFGAPPAAWRKRVEAVLLWFDPTPSAKTAKTRSA